MRSHLLHNWLLAIAGYLLLLPASAQSGASADDAFYRASKVYEYGRNHEDHYESRSALRTAELSFRNFIRNHPGHGERQTAYYRMAVCQLLTGNNDSAEANFNFVIDKYKKGQLVAASAYRMGAQRYNEQNYEKAQNYFKIAATQSEKPAVRQQALYQQARCLMLTGDKSSALSPLRRLVKEDNNAYQATGRLALAHILFEINEFDEALGHFEKLQNKIGIGQDIKAEAKLYTGLTHARLGDEDKALSMISEMIDASGIKNEYKARAQNELYNIYFSRDEIDNIIDNYAKGVYPGEPIITARTYLIAGYALLRKNYFQRAITAFTSVERLVPNSALSYEASYRRLYCFYQMNGANVVDQADAFNEIYGSYQKDSEWHKLTKVFKAESLLHTGQAEDAAKIYRSINSKDLPENAQANFLFKKMTCLADAEDNSGAISAAGHFISDFPAHDLVYEVHARRGNAYIANTNYGAALTDFQKILKEQPDSALSAIALQGMITAYRKERKYEELVVACQLLVEKFPGLKKASKAHAYYWMGWGYFKQELFAEAIPPLERARSISPQFYKEPAGTRIFLSTYYLQDPDLMKSAHQRVMTDVPGKYFPPRMLAWLGIQRFQKEDYATSATVLDNIANREEPLETPIDVWRYLTKANLQLGKYQEALDSVEQVSEREEESFWKADALLDKSQALLGLGKNNECIAIAEEGLYYKPKGTIEAGLRFSIAEAKYRNGELDAAKDEYLLVASKFEGDETVRPYALWKTAQVLKIQESPASQSMLDSIKEEYPDWQEPEE